MAHYVVVANKTLAGDALSAHLGAILRNDPAPVFRAVVPVSLPNPVAFEVGGAMGGIAVVDIDGRVHALQAAQQRLDDLLAWLRAVGVPATGEVVVGDPVPAVEQLIADGEVAEVIVSTLPATVSRWLRLDLPQRLRRRLSVPVTVLEAVGDSLTAPDVAPGTARADAPDVAEAPALRPTALDDGDTAETGVATHDERKQARMGESVYKIIELVGTSTESWEKAAAAAVRTAQQSLRDLRIAEVVQLDLVVGDGEATVYRAKVKVSFKYQLDGD